MADDPKHLTFVIDAKEAGALQDIKRLQQAMRELLSDAVKADKALNEMMGTKSALETRQLMTTMSRVAQGDRETVARNLASRARRAQIAADPASIEAKIQSEEEKLMESRKRMARRFLESYREIASINRQLRDEESKLTATQQSEMTQRRDALIARSTAGLNDSDARSQRRSLAQVTSPGSAQEQLTRWFGRMGIERAEAAQMVPALMRQINADIEAEAAKAAKKAETQARQAEAKAAREQRQASKAALEAFKKDKQAEIDAAVTAEERKAAMTKLVNQARVKAEAEQRQFDQAAHERYIASRWRLNDAAVRREEAANRAADSDAKKRLGDFTRAEADANRELMKEFKRVDLKRLGTLDPADRAAEFQEIKEGFKDRLRQQNSSYQLNEKALDHEYDMWQRNLQLQNEINEKKRQQRDTLKEQEQIEKRMNAEAYRRFKEVDLPRINAIEDKAERANQLNRTVNAYKGQFDALGVPFKEDRFRETGEISEEKRLRRAQDRLIRPERAAVDRNLNVRAFGGAAMFQNQMEIMTNWATMAAVIGSVGYAANFAVQFESALAQLQAISSSSKTEIKGLRNEIVDLSTATKFSATEITDAATTMAQAGFSATQIASSLSAVTKLAVATGTDLKTTVDTITSTMTVFDLQTSEAENVANSLTAAMNLSKLTIDKFSLGLQYSGNIAETVGVQYNELAALMGGMADAGVRSGSTLGTGLRQLILDIQNPTRNAQDVFNRVGLSASDLDIEANGIIQVLRNLRDANLSAGDASQAFEVRAVAAYKALINQLPQIEQLNTAILSTNAANEAAAIQMDTVAARWNQFSQAMVTSISTGFEPVMEALKIILQGATFLAKQLVILEPVLNATAVALAGVATALVLTRIGALIVGFRQLQGAIAAVYTAAATAAKSNVWLIAITVAATAAYGALAYLAGSAERAAEKLDKVKDAVNKTSGEMDETKQSLEAVSDQLDRLLTRFATLSDESSPDLQAELALLQTRFTQLGFSIDDSGASARGLITELVALNDRLNETLALQGLTKLASLETVKSGLVSSGAEYLRTGKYGEEQLTQTSTMKYVADFVNPKGAFYKSLDPKLQEIMRRYSGLQTDKASAGSFFENFDVTAIQNDLGAVSEVYLRYKSMASTGNKQFTGELEALEGMISFIEGALKVGKELEAVNYDIRNTKSSVRKADVEKHPVMQLLLEQVSNAQGDLNTAIFNAQDETGVGALSAQERMRVLAEQFAPDIKRFNDQRTSIINQWIAQGFVTDIKEAEALFDSTKAGGLIKTFSSRASGKIGELNPEARKQIAESSKAALDESKASARALVAEANIRNTNVSPDLAAAVAAGSSTLTVDPATGKLVKPSFETSFAALQKDLAKGRAAIDDIFKSESPGAFEIGQDGQRKDKGGYDKYLEEVLKYEEFRKDMTARLLRVYNRDDEEGSKQRAVNSRIYMLKQKRDAINASMDEIRGSVDSQSDPAAILDSRAKWLDLMTELTGITAELEGLEWDERNYKDPDQAVINRAQTIKDALLELDRKGAKTVGDFDNLSRDADNKLRSMQAAVQRKNLSRLAAAATTGAFADEASARKQIEEIGRLTGEIIVAYTNQFKNDLQNNERLENPLVQQRYQDGMVDLLNQQVDQVLGVIQRMIENRSWEAGADLRSIQQTQNALGNSRNRGRFSSTAEAFYGRKAEAANEGFLYSQMTGKASELQMLQDLKNELDFTLLTTAEGSAEYNSALEQSTVVAERLLQVTRELGDATSAYGAATEKVKALSFSESLTTGLNEFMQSSGMMVGGWEKFANGLTSTMGVARDSIVEALTSIAMHAEDTGDALEGMARRIGQSLVELGMQMLTDEIIKYVIKTIIGMAGGSWNTSHVPTANAPGSFSSPAASIPVTRSQGGMVDGSVKFRDSVPALLEPEEFVMRKNAVQTIGVDALEAMNRTGQLATSITPVGVPTGEGGVVNVWIVKEKEQARMGPKDVIAVVSKDMLENGDTGKLVKSIAMGRL